MEWVAALSLVLVALINAGGLIIVAKLSRTIKTLEINTNSIKDALVATTDEAAQLRGEKKGRADERGDRLRESG